MSEIIDFISWIVHKTCWSLSVFLQFFIYRLLDVFGLCFNIIACCTIVRLPAMLFHLTHLGSWWEWRFIGFVQCLIFIMDIPIMIMGLFILCTLIKIYPLVKEIKEERIFVNMDYFSRNKIVFSGFKVRGIIIKHFVTLIVDLFCFVFVLVCLISWRNVIFCRRFVSAEGEWEKRKVIFIEFFQVIFDIPLLLCFIITLFSWRSQMLYIDLRYYRTRGKVWDDIRFLGLSHTFYGLLDIPCIISFLVTLFTWRSPILIYSLIGSRPLDRSDHWISHWRIREVCIRQFLYLFIDFPAICAAVFTFASIWRFPNLMKQIKKHLQKEFNRSNLHEIESDIRGSCFKQFGMIWVDFFSIVLALIIFFTLWRADPLYKDIKKIKKEYEESIERNEYAGSLTQERNVEGRNMAVENDISAHVDSGHLFPTMMTTVSDDVRENITSNTTVDSNEDAVGKLKWSQCMWKIRRKVVFHFLMILVDVPAMPLAVLVVFTGLRTSKLISRLIGGEFYMLFAITVYMETLKLFRDIAFIFLFIILIVLQPIQSWVHLLEDDEHKDYRILSDLILWIPDICLERKEIYEIMEDRLALFIKQKKDKCFIKKDLCNVFHKHLMRISYLQMQLEASVTDSELLSFSKMVDFVETKRVGKMLRKFYIESSYILNCDPNLHEQNLKKYKDEIIKFEEEVDSAYESLLNYKPAKVPLYALQSGLKLRTSSETRQVLIDCLPRGNIVVAIIGFLCLLLIYRGPAMIKALHKKMYNKYDIVLHTIHEYLKDFLALLQIILVLLFLYRAPIMLADIMDCIIQKHSWKAVRKIVKKYPPEICHDFGQLASKILSWETPRYIFVMLLFGILMPAELFLNILRIRIRGKIQSLLYAVLLYSICVIAPIMFMIYGTEKLLSLHMGWLIQVCISAILFFLFLLLLIMILNLAKDRNNKLLFAVRKCDYVRLNWHNIHVLIFEFLEFLQTLALVFRFSSIPMFGGSVLKTISDYLLFSFLSHNVVFWITVGLFFCWFFLCGAPYIFENILENYDIGVIGGRPSWRLALSFLANTMFVTIIENFSSTLACTYSRCNAVDGSITLSAMFLHGTVDRGTYNPVCNSIGPIEDLSVRCWTGEHQGKATFALAAIIWYSTTSLIFGTKYGDPGNKELDIAFCPMYNMVINVFKAGMIVVATILPDHKYVIVGVLLATNICCSLFTLKFRYLFNEDACNLHSVLVWRFCTFLSCTLACIGVLVAFLLDDVDSIMPLLIFVGGTTLIFCLSIIACIKLSGTSAIEQNRESFKQLIILLEKRIFMKNWMHLRWQKERKMWHQLVQNVHEAWNSDRYLSSNISNLNSNENRNVTQMCYVPDSTLELEKNGRNLLLILEKHIHYSAYRYSFITERIVWINMVCESNWTGLLQLLSILNENLQGDFNKPSTSDITLHNISTTIGYILGVDKQDSAIAPPPFIKKTKEQIAIESNQMRVDVLNFVGKVDEYRKEYVEMFEKLLPTIPVFKACVSQVGNERFEISFRRQSTGVITECESPGHQIVVGACIKIGKTLSGHVVGNTITFDNHGNFVVKKGLLSFTVSRISLFHRNTQLYLSANGREVKYDVALSSCKTIEWS